MSTLRLTPSGRLALDLAQADATPAVQDLAARFAADWREGLFYLGARRGQVLGRRGRALLERHLSSERRPNCDNQQL